MKRLIVASLALSFSVAACGDDTVEAQLGKVDTEALMAGPAVVLSGDLGTVDVPLERALPAGDAEQIAADFEGTVSLVVSSRETGSSADLAAGTLVSANPAAPGEYAWTIDEDRTTVTLEFYNQTPGGLTLKVGRTYDVQFAVQPNGWVDIVPTMEFSVVPSGG
ncbi:MAG: hypothetical protein D6705_11460 [Deltaproteobacteria bacterium]|nr:MAG: hypothetical protein D6705_11460 [Deltaproteobacteria bacterium]